MRLPLQKRRNDDDEEEGNASDDSEWRSGSLAPQASRAKRARLRIRSPLPGELGDPNSHLARIVPVKDEELEQDYYFPPELLSHNLPVTSGYRRSVSPAGSVFSVASELFSSSTILPPVHHLRQANPRIAPLTSTYDESAQSAIAVKARLAAAASRTLGSGYKGIPKRTSSLMQFDKKTGMLKTLKGKMPPPPPPQVDNSPPLFHDNERVSPPPNTSRDDDDFGFGTWDSEPAAARLTPPTTGRGDDDFEDDPGFGTWDSDPPPSISDTRLISESPSRTPTPPPPEIITTAKDLLELAGHVDTDDLDDFEDDPVEEIAPAVQPRQGFWQQKDGVLNRRVIFSLISERPASSDGWKMSSKLFASIVSDTPTTCCLIPPPPPTTWKDDVVTFRLESNTPLAPLRFRIVQRFPSNPALTYPHYEDERCLDDVLQRCKEPLGLGCLPSSDLDGVVKGGPYGKLELVDRMSLEAQKLRMRLVDTVEAQRATMLAYLPRNDSEDAEEYVGALAVFLSSDLDTVVSFGIPKDSTLAELAGVLLAMYVLLPKRVHLDALELVPDAIP